MSIFQEPGGDCPLATNNETNEQREEIYGEIDASKTLILHGLESDWIEEEMADDDDFK